MASAIGAGFGADMLQEILRRKFQEVIAQKQLEQQAARDASIADLGRGNLDVSRGNLAMREKEFQAATAPKAPEPLKPMAVGGRIVDPSSGKVIYEPPKEAPATTPVLRINPRSGKMESLGDAPKGAHFVNEPAPPAPQGPTHARFNIVQGADANGKPAMIRTNVDTGEIEVLPVPAGAAFVKRDQPATADQTNMAIYASRISQAEPTLKKLEAGIAAMNPVSYLAQTKIDNPALQSQEMQSYQQAARQFINSVLRRESGAAISAGEFDSARKQYLPMPGDSSQVLAQKAAARADVIQQFQRGAGPALSRSQDNQQTKETPEQRIQRLLGGGK